MTRRHGRLGAALLFAGVLCLVVAVALCFRQPGQTRAETLRVQRIGTVATLAAGEPLVLEVATDAGRSGTAEVLVRSAMTSHVLSVAITDGEGRVTVPPEIARRAGLLELRAGGLVETVSIMPGPAVGPARPLVGPRTIVADNTDATLAVLIAKDAFANLAVDGTTVDFTASQPGDRRTTRSGSTRLGLAWALFPSGQTNGPSYIQAEVSGSTGPRVRIDEVAGPATAIVAVVESALPTADGRSLVQLGSLPIVDGYDNLLPDGVAGSFIITTDLGVDTVPAAIQNGRFHTWWPAPDEPTTATVVAIVNGVASNPIDLDFAPAVTEIPVEITNEGGATVVEVGPVVGPDGAHIDNGTAVVIDGTQTALRDGHATARFDDLRTAVTVEILGVRSQAGASS